MVKKDVPRCTSRYAFIYARKFRDSCSHSLNNISYYAPKKNSSCDRNNLMHAKIFNVNPKVACNFCREHDYLAFECKLRKSLNDGAL